MRITYFLLKYQEDIPKHNMASTQETGLFSPREKVPVQCLDNPFGFNAEVIYEDKSMPLHRCTPFLTINRIQNLPTLYGNEGSDAEAEETPESRHQMQSTSSSDNRGQPNATPRPVLPEDTDAHNNHNQLTFTDGGSPLTMAMGGMGNYKPRQMESLQQLEEEEWDKHPRTRIKKVGKKGGKKSRRKRHQ